MCKTDLKVLQCDSDKIIRESTPKKGERIKTEWYDKREERERVK